MKSTYDGGWRNRPLNKSVFADYLSTGIACGLLALSVVRTGYTQPLPAGTSWMQVRGPYSGDIALLTVDRRGYCYVSDPFSGIHRSTDRGGTWTAENNGVNWWGLSSLVVDSANRIYAGSLWNGLYTSSNDGDTWTKTWPPGGAESELVLSGGRICLGGYDTVSVSTDGGQSWYSSRVSDATGSVISLAEDRAGNIYAGLAVIVPRSLPAYGGGVYISSDSGRSWDYYGKSLDSIKTIVATKSGKVFILTPLGILSAGIKDSNWTRDVLGLPNAGVAGMVSDPAGDVVVYANNVGLYVYRDSGNYWVQVSSGISSADVTAFSFDPNGTCYAGTAYDGAFLLSGPTANWIQCGIFPTVASAIGFDQLGNLYVGTHDGVYKPGYENGTWIRASTGLADGVVYKIDTLSFINGVFAATSAGLFFSTDRGGLWNFKPAGWIYDMAEVSGGYLYAATSKGVIESSDEGNDWTSPASIGFPTGSAFSLLHDTKLFAGTENNGVFVTTDGGNFWTQTGIGSPLMFCSVNALGQNSAGLFAGTDTAGAFFTADRGQSWTRVPTIAAANVSCFLLNHANKSFAGTLDGGIFTSSDGGVIWNSMNDGLTTAAVYSLAIDPQGYLYAATDSGVFKSVDMVTGISEPRSIPKSISLGQNYPNPFNPSTMISYRLSVTSLVSLKVYDVLGREVMTLVNEVKKPGIYEVKFDGNALSSGVYFYRLAAGDDTETKKMVLVK